MIAYVVFHPCLRGLISNAVLDDNRGMLTSVALMGTALIVYHILSVMVTPVLKP